MELKRVWMLNRLYLGILTVLFILLFIIFTGISCLNPLQNTLVLLIFIVSYWIFFILILNAKKAYLFLNNLLVGNGKNISEIENPPKEEIKVIVTEIKQKKKKYKYYGSTKANTYHLEKCRFSGMIKQEFLVQKNKNDYFKKKKFHACKNCRPDKN